MQFVLDDCLFFVFFSRCTYWPTFGDVPHHGGSIEHVYLPKADYIKI